MQIEGTAPDLHGVNVFIDTLKYTNVKVGNVTQRAFSDVVESSFGLNASGANFSISLKFVPALFAGTKLDDQDRIIRPILTVSKQITTRSALDEKSSSLFKDSGSEAGQ